MKYYLVRNCILKKYDRLSFVFARINNPDNEFFELNNTGEILMEFIIKNNGATKEELIDYLYQNLVEFDDDRISEVTEFLDILLNKGILCLQ